MAIVYDLPQVELQPQPMRELQAPTGKNFAAEQAVELGKNTTAAGNVMIGIANDIQKNIDEARTKEADASLARQLNTLLHDPNSGYLNMPGKAAIDGKYGVDKAMSDILKPYEDTLGNDTQRSMFKMVAEKRLLDARNSIDAHAAKQSKVYNIKASDDRAEAFMNDALSDIRNYNVPNSKYQQSAIMMSNERGNATTLSIGVKAGDPSYDMQVKSQMSKLVDKGVENLLLADDVRTAQDYYVHHKDQILPEMQKSISGKLVIEVGNLKGKEFADGMWKKDVLPKLSVDDQPDEAALKSAVEGSSLDKTGKKAALNWLRDKVEELKRDRTANNQVFSNSIHSMMTNDKDMGQYYTVDKEIEKYRGKINSTHILSMKNAVRIFYHIDKRFEISLKKKEKEEEERLKLVQQDRFYEAQMDIQRRLARGEKVTTEEWNPKLSYYGPFTSKIKEYTNKANALKGAYNEKEFSNMLEVLSQSRDAEKNGIPNRNDKAKVAELREFVINDMHAYYIHGEKRTLKQSMMEGTRYFAKKGWGFWSTDVPLSQINTRGNRLEDMSEEGIRAYERRDLIEQGFAPSVVDKKLEQRYGKPKDKTTGTSVINTDSYSGVETYTPGLGD